MKKSLSMVLATAMVFSTFATSAFAAEEAAENTQAADEANEQAADEASLDAQAKFDALKEAGIFDGYDDGSAGLDREMTRAEYAAVLVRLMGLEKDSTGASYTDTEEHWAHTDGYIEAVTSAKLMEGPADGIFDPDGKVTIEQLAAIMVRALELEVDDDAEVDGEASDWAKGYVAAAVEAGLIPNGADYTENAKRELLVEVTYAAKDQIPAKVVDVAAITEFEATGAYKLTVELNGAVDDSKAEFAVTRDGEELTIKEVKWAEDKASADLIFEDKLLEGEYEVTLSGVEVDEDNAKATANVEDEKVTKIEFVTASETIPMASDLRIEFQAVNQYGEEADIPSNEFDIDVTGVDDGDWTTVSGLPAIELDLGEDENEDDEYDRNDRITVQVKHDESQVAANKVFTIGDEQYITKVEIGKLMDSTGKEIESVEEGDDDVYLQVFAYDQYGLRVLYEDTLADDIDLSGSSDIDVYDEEAERFSEDVDNDKYPDLRLQVEEDADDGDHTITIYAASSSESKQIKIVTDSKPSQVKFAVSSITMSTLDGRSGSTDSSSVLYDRYVPIVVLNENGEELSKDEIVEAYLDEDLLEVDTSGSVDDAEIVTSGAFKGQVLIKAEDDAGSGTVELTIDNKPEEKATLKVRVADAREIEEIRLTKNNGDKGINIDVDGDGVIAIEDEAGAGTVAGAVYKTQETADAQFKFGLFDQYGDLAVENGYTEDRNGDPVKYRVDLEFTGPSDATLATPYIDMHDGQTVFSDSGLNTPLAGQWTVNQTVYGDIKNVSDQEFRLYANVPGVYKVRAKLMQQVESDPWREIDSITKTYEVLDTEGETYTWSAEFKRPVVASDLVQVPNFAKIGSGNGPAVADLKAMGKEIGIVAKDGSDKLVVPDVVDQITTTGTLAKNAIDKGVGYIGAVDDKVANATVRFRTNRGLQTATLKFKGSNAPLNITEFTGGKVVRILDNADITVGLNLYDDKLFDEYKAIDSTYGNEYSKGEFAVKGVDITYSVIDQQHGDDVLELDADGTITNFVANHPSGSFTIKITAPSGVERLLELGYN